MIFTKKYFGNKVKQILNQVHSDLKIHNKGINFLYNFFKPFYEIMNDSIKLLDNYEKKSIEKLIKCIFYDSDELSKYAIKNINDELYETVFKEKIWIDDERLLHKYLSMTLEYLIAEILELSGNVARDNQKKVINNYHVWLAISLDLELNKFFKKYGFDQYKFDKDELIKDHAKLNNYLYYHTIDGEIYNLEKEELIEKYKYLL